MSVTKVFIKSEGVLVEQVGHLWAAFSPASGESALINDESAAVLEVLSAGPAGTSAVSIALATDSGLAMESLVPIVDQAWPTLVEAGLVHELRNGHVGLG